MNGHTIFITGGAGYIGAMLCDQLSKREDVAKIVALDKEALPEFLKGNSKIMWVKANTSEQSEWWDTVMKESPDLVIHTAWQIREMYGNKKLQWKWNVEGSGVVFDFALTSPSVKKLIYFSTASIYGAFATNTFEHLFTEDEPLREDEYLYGVEKRAVEEILKSKYADHTTSGARTPSVSIVRLAAVTGPRGRYMRVRFGLQAALSGQLKGSLIHKMISFLVSYVPATKGWVRQFVHEDDVMDAVTMLALAESKSQYEIFNLTPPGEPVYAKQMAEAVGKKLLPVTPFMVRMAFFFFWNVTRGRVPTSRGGWKFYSYPIVMDGSKISREYGYTYVYNSRDAFKYTTGRYEEFVPVEKRMKKS